MRWNDEEAWVRSPGLAHEPLIGAKLFEAAQARRAANGRTTIRKPRRTPRPYLRRFQEGPKTPGPSVSLTATS
jgi:hypothetical protein